MKKKWYNTMRWKRIRVFFRRNFGSSVKIKRPVGMTSEVDTALRIWTRVVHTESSELLYNPVTQECYAEWVDESNPVYLFLESGRLRIVNTVIGYDVNLRMDEENWCTEVFNREVNRRRSEFKRIALGKIIHSLDALELRLQGKSIDSAFQRMEEPANNDWLFSQKAD